MIAPILLAIAGMIGTNGCYATHSVSPGAISELRQGNRSRELVLQSGESSRVRIGPTTRVRFQRVDGLFTTWVEARSLRVGPQSVMVGADPNAALILRWDDLARIEVNDVDSGRTVIGIVAGTSMVVLAAAAEVIVIAALEAVTGAHFRGDLGITRATLEAVLEHADDQRPDDDPDALSPRDRSSDTPEESLAIRGSPLFTSEARRRDLVRFGASVETGIEMGGGLARSEATVNVGLRLLNTLELGAGIGTTGSIAEGNGQQSLALVSTAARIVPRVRLGLHLDLDPSRRVALALGQQVGFSTHGWVDLRTEWGVRVRLGERLQLGIYPLNPRVGWQDTVAVRTSYVSAVELGWVM